MDKKDHIMIVDDSTQDIHILMECLGAEHQVTAATSPIKALNMLEGGALPDIILLDVNMPEINGYDFCRQLKNQPKFQKIKIVFISANDSTDEIITGLDAGAIDYIVKPFDSKIISSKVKHVLAIEQEMKHLMAAASSANELVHTVMSDSAYMGIVFKYLRNCFNIDSIQDLINETVECLNELKLKAIIFFKYKSLEEIESNHGHINLLEVDLLNRMYRNPTPIYEKGNRLFIIKGSVVICIKNLPAEETKRGSLRDYLILFAEAHDTKLIQIYENNQQALRNANLKSLINEFKNALNELRSNQETHKQLGITIMDELINSVEELYYSIGLTEVQESKISEAIRDKALRFLDLIDIGSTLDAEMQRIVNGLTNVSEERDQPQAPSL